MLSSPTPDELKPGMKRNESNLENRPAHNVIKKCAHRNSPADHHLITTLTLLSPIFIIATQPGWRFELTVA